MTVGELKKRLSKYDDDVLVLHSEDGTVDLKPMDETLIWTGDAVLINAEDEAWEQGTDGWKAHPEAYDGDGPVRVLIIG